METELILELQKLMEEYREEMKEFREEVKEFREEWKSQSLTFFDDGAGDDDSHFSNPSDDDDEMVKAVMTQRPPELENHQPNHQPQTESGNQQTNPQPQAESRFTVEIGNDDLDALSKEMDEFSKSLEQRHKSLEEKIQQQAPGAPGNSNLYRNLNCNPKLEFPTFEVSTTIAPEMFDECPKKNSEKYFVLCKIPDEQRKVLDCVHDTYTLDLEGNDLVYDSRIVSTFGAFPRVKLKLNVLFEDTVLIRSNGNCSPDHTNEKGHTCFAIDFLIASTSSLLFVYSLDYARSRLTKAATNCKNVLSLTEFELMELLDVGLSQVDSAVAQISEITCPPYQAALSLWKQHNQIENHHGRLPTHLKGLDAALCGGIPAGVLNELVGPTGIGKTQFCLKLSLLASLPIAYGGLTEFGLNSFPEVFRMKGMAKEMAGRILVLQPQSLFEFTDSLQQIKISLLQQQVKLLIVDSMTALVSGKYEQGPARHHSLGWHISFIKLLAEFTQLPVVMTNQVRSQSFDQISWYSFQGRYVNKEDPTRSDSHLVAALVSRVVLGKEVGNTGVVAAIQLSHEHNANVEETRQELHELHPKDTHIVVQHQLYFPIILNQTTLSLYLLLMVYRSTC